MTGMCEHRVAAGSFCKKCGEKTAGAPKRTRASAEPVSGKPLDEAAMKRVAHGRLDEATARALTDEVKRDAAALWRKLARLYDEGAHTLLGYPSWSDYFAHEFNIGKSRGYRLLAAAHVAEALESQSPMGESPTLNERQARELAPLKDKPDLLSAAWVEAQADGEPTAVKIRAAVAARLPGSSRPTPEPQLCLSVSEVRLVIDGDAAAVGRLRARVEAL